MPDFSRLISRSGDLPATSTFSRWVLDVLVVFNVITQAILVVVLLLGRMAASTTPIAGGAALAMFLLAYFYVRWLVPVLNRRQTLVVLMVKELAMLLLLGMAAGLVALVRWTISMF